MHSVPRQRPLGSWSLCRFFSARAIFGSCDGKWCPMCGNRILIGLGKSAAVALILAWSLFPIAFVVLSSFKPGRDIFAVPPRFLFDPTVQHYLALATTWGGFFQGLYNSLNVTHAALILLYATFFVSLGTLLMRTFIDQVPRELDEAALIDGAGRVKILTGVIVPLVAPGMLAVAVFVVVYAWNEFLFAFIFTATKAKTAPLVISEMIGSID